MLGGVTLIVRIVVALYDHVGNFNLTENENLNYFTMATVNVLSIVKFISTAVGEALGYFTMVTNTFAAFYFIYVAFGIKWKADFLERIHFLSALMVFLTLASLIYHILLSAAWQPTGIRWIISFVYHTLMPLMVLFYWFPI